MRALAWRFAAWFTALAVLRLEALAPGNLMPKFDTAPLPGETGATPAAPDRGPPGLLSGALRAGRDSSRRAVAGSDRTGGLAGGLVGMLFASVLLTAVNPFTLIVLLPAGQPVDLDPGLLRLGRRAAAR